MITGTEDNISLKLVRKCLVQVAPVPPWGLSLCHAAVTPSRALEQGAVFHLPCYPELMRTAALSLSEQRLLVKGNTASLSGGLAYHLFSDWLVEIGSYLSRAVFKFTKGGLKLLILLPPPAGISGEDYDTQFNGVTWIESRALCTLRL